MVAQIRDIGTTARIDTGTLVICHYANSQRLARPLPLQVITINRAFAEPDCAVNRIYARRARHNG